MDNPLFLPAMTRQILAARFAQATLSVEVDLPEAKPPQPRLVALDAAERHRRRKTRTQTLQRHAQPEGARVRISAEQTAPTWTAPTATSARSTTPRARPR